MRRNRLFTASEAVGFLILAAVIFVALPMLLDNFRLNLFGKYLTYAFVAIGLVLCWGAGGILSLGQGVFFGLGGYCMAMFLKLEASTPENTSDPVHTRHSRFHGLEPTDRIALCGGSLSIQPELSRCWRLSPCPCPFCLCHRSLRCSRRRVGGVYFAIITQAFAAILTILIIGQQGYTGGVNGITDLRTLQRLGHPHG